MSQLGLVMISYVLVVWRGGRDYCATIFWRERVRERETRIDTLVHVPMLARKFP